MIEANLTTFEREVLLASHGTLVLVDFWAPWCGPCRALGPVLERVETVYGGRFRLVKVNSDENPELSERFMVRSIPYVLAFADGKPVDGFVGALPESEVRAFIDRHLPTVGEVERRKALQLLERGEIATAVATLRAALALEPDNEALKLDLAEALLNRHPGGPDAHQLDEAQRALSGVGARSQADARRRALQVRLESLRTAAMLPDLDTLRAAVSSNAADLGSRMALAQRYIARGELQSALDELLEIIKRNRQFEDGAARHTVLSVLELAADQPQLVSEYRKRLSLLLNR